MKKFFVVAFALLVVACSATKTSSNPNSITERQVATDFTDEGIKVTYTFTGKLEKIEIFGQADAWKGNVEVLAEADAYAKLVKFIYGAKVTTDRYTKIMSLAIEKAQDSKNNKSLNADGVMDFTDKDLESEINSQSPSIDSSALKSASVVNKTMLTTATLISSKGRLTGVRKVRDYTQNNGKLYVAVYQWSDKDQATSQHLREQMSR